MNQAMAQHGYRRRYPKRGNSADTVNTKFSVVRLPVDGICAAQASALSLQPSAGFLGDDGAWSGSGPRPGVIWLRMKCNLSDAWEGAIACRDQAATVVFRAPKLQSRDFQLPSCAVSRIS